MKRQTLYILFQIFSVWLTVIVDVSCADDLHSDCVFDSGAGEVSIHFSLDKAADTRGDGSVDFETAIDHAYLLFYTDDVSLENSTPFAAVRAVVSESDQSALYFKMPLRLTPDTDYKLLAIANADRFTPEGFGSFADYLQSWSVESQNARERLCLFHANRINAGDGALLPMSGSVADGAPFRFSMQNGSYSVSATLSFKRTVARIDVANIVRDGFEVEGVALCNWRDRVPAITSEGETGNVTAQVCGILTDEGVDSSSGMFIDMPDTEESGVQKLEKSIYCFPSLSYNAAPSDKESTALIIKARYGDDSESSYYRVNVNAKGNKSEVKANTKYLVTIQSVKGSGAPTVAEAYSAEESQIVLSVVEDWDLDGSFAMDDKGNFIVLSTGRMEFEGDVVESRVLRVLVSNGMSWSIDYIADSDDAAAAFSATRISETSLAIGPVGRNESDDILSGRFVVTAQTSEGRRLSVDVLVSQNVTEEQWKEPTVPADMPFALIPSSYDRLKIDHAKKTIEIDGFEPDCFNSFIDIPFNVYVNDAVAGTVSSVSITSTLQWPLEGGVSKTKHADQLYCPNSFVVSGNVNNNVYSLSQQKELTKAQAFGTSNLFTASKDGMIYVSVGAMAPDDPAIVREITLSANGESVTYELTIKPRFCIIDDVILADASGNYFLVQDRNIVDLENSRYLSYLGFDEDGRKHQAYNYSYLYNSISIPNKYDSDGLAIKENQHEMLMGCVVKYSDRNKIGSKIHDWLDIYHNSVSRQKGSPFFEEDCFEKWRIPDASMMSTLVSNIRFSKMRMYFNSEISARNKKTSIPVCCYLPYQMFYMGETGDTFSKVYFLSSDGVTPNAAIMIYLEKSEIKTHTPTLSTSPKISSYSGLTRLVRPLTDNELEDYKNYYLGYGSLSHRLTVCHPDTYESTSLGWLSY